MFLKGLVISVKLVPFNSKPTYQYIFQFASNHTKKMNSFSLTMNGIDIRFALGLIFSFHGSMLTLFFN